MSADSEAALWRFSLDRYGRPGAAEACLDLQDRLGADVNLALYCLYLGFESGHAVSTPDLAALERRVVAWRRTVVAPLRAMRRALKGWAAEGPPSARVERFRETLKARELEAERLQQALLAAMDPLGTPAPAGAALAAQNLRAYLVWLSGERDLSDADERGIRVLTEGGPGSAA